MKIISGYNLRVFVGIISREIRVYVLFTSRYTRNEYLISKVYACNLGGERAFI